jgi:hypothetical protein
LHRRTPTGYSTQVACGPFQISWLLFGCPVPF